MHYDQVESGMRIQQLRKQCGMTQEQLAERVHVTANNLSRLERGLHGPSIDVLVDLASVFGVTLDYIILGRESKINDTKAALRAMASALIELEQNL